MNDQHKQPPPLSERELKGSQEEVIAKLRNYLNEDGQDFDTLPEDVKQAQGLLEKLVQKGEVAGEVKRLKSPNGLYLFCVGGRLIDASESYLVKCNGSLIVRSRFPSYCVDFAASHYALKPLSEIMADINKGKYRIWRSGMTDPHLAFYAKHHLGLHPIELWKEGEEGEGYFQYPFGFDPSVPPLQEGINIRVPYWSSDFAASYPHAIFQSCFPDYHTKHAFATIGGVAVEQLKDVMNNILEITGIVRVFVPCSEKKAKIGC